MLMVSVYLGVMFLLVSCSNNKYINDCKFSGISISIKFDRDMVAYTECEFDIYGRIR